MNFIKTNLVISKLNSLFRALGNLLSILSSLFRTLGSSIYARSFMYVAELIIILSVIYISINTYYFEIDFEIYFLKNKIELAHLWVFVGIIIAKNIAIFVINKLKALKSEDLKKENLKIEDLMFKIADKLLKALMNIIITICSLLLVNISNGLSQLKINYIDKLDLSTGFSIIRIWNKEELKEYLFGTLLKNPSILAHFQNLKVILPLPEKLISKILTSSNNIADVDNAVLNVIQMIKSEKELLEKELAAKQASEMINEMTEMFNTKTAHLDSSAFWSNMGLLIGGSIAICIVASAVVAIYEVLQNPGNPENHSSSQDNNDTVDSTYQQLLDYLLKGKPIPKIDGRLKSLSDKVLTLEGELAKSNTHNNLEIEKLRVAKDHIVGNAILTRDKLFEAKRDIARLQVDGRLKSLSDKVLTLEGELAKSNTHNNLEIEKLTIAKDRIVNNATYIREKLVETRYYINQVKVEIGQIKENAENTEISISEMSQKFESEIQENNELMNSYRIDLSSNIDAVNTLTSEMEEVTEKVGGVTSKTIDLVSLDKANQILANSVINLRKELKYVQDDSDANIEYVDKQMKTLQTALDTLNTKLDDGITGNTEIVREIQETLTSKIEIQEIVREIVKEIIAQNS